MQSWVTHGLMTPAQMIGPDGLHMTDAGYRQLARPPPPRSSSAPA